MGGKGCQEKRAVVIIPETYKIAWSRKKPGVLGFKIWIQERRKCTSKSLRDTVKQVGKAAK